MNLNETSQGINEKIMDFSRVILIDGLMSYIRFT